MFDFFTNIFNNKLLFFGIIVVIGFVIFTIILIKKANKEEKEASIDIEKIDGNNSLFDEVIKTDDLKTSDGKLDLDSMIEKMQQDLDAKASEVVEKFENEQEEKSVISYQELVNKENSKTEEKIQNKAVYLNDVFDKMDGAHKNTLVAPEVKNDYEITEDNEKYVTDDLKETYVNALELEEKSLLDSQSVADEISDLVTTNLNKKDEYVNAIKTGDFEEKEHTKFKSTDFISPIYGIQDIKVQYPTVQNIKNFRENNYKNIELEQTLNMAPLSEEIKRDEDFLNALKEFRKNLE